MDRSKLVAVVTGAIALLLGVAYLLVVQLLDFRGEMVPAPQSLSERPEVVAIYPTSTYFYGFNSHQVI
ncbi:glucose-inhibited division protein A [Oscillatoria sp. FACHB-1407]|uniref:hypothetical protein n=1 Tax=Oscillatoria sp. FACHB-1407 TaxID=2692847 RepID=UPI001684253C|nr:hypothetical protein [Oscillatoria sp. FACHB-1407]MBD2460244.1 glucose-inhibited division protein A [Oscillatoria sp. FACHB-1407]